MFATRMKMGNGQAPLITMKERFRLLVFLGLQVIHIPGSHAALDTQQLHWSRNSSLDGMWSRTEGIDEMVSTSATQCARRCGNHIACTAFFYSPDEQRCQLHSSSQAIQPVPALNSTKFYAMTPVVEELYPIPCPPMSQLSSETAVISDGTSFTYLMYTSASTYSIAETSCSYQGMEPVTVTSLAKLHAIQYILTFCEGYMGGTGNYWVNGQYSQNGGGYTTSAGLPVPALFWAPGEPNSPDINTHVMISVNHGLQFVATPPTVDNLYICELPAV